MISAQGYQPVTTELFVAGDPYLDSDAVFGVRESLIVPFVRHDANHDLPESHFTVDYDFVLEPA